MKQVKKQKLLDAGYLVTDTKEFLGLSDSEAAIIELKVALVQRLREAWFTRDVAQNPFAKSFINQSLIENMEISSSDTTLDLIKTLFALGITPKELGKTIEQAECVTSVRH